MKNAKRKQDIRLWMKFLLVVILAVILRIFVFEFVNISGESMSPTLENGQLIIIYKVEYTPARGDIVVLNSPDGVEMVKRIIGLPGETIRIADGIVYVNGERIADEYQFSTTELIHNITIPTDKVYVLGDNRDHSSDSRDFGSIEISDIRGEMVFTVY